jgi:hypothetical protein
MMFLGSAFAALGLFLQNALLGNLPRSLGGIERHLFAFHSLMLLVLSLVTALRMARLHGGMILNGILFARLLRGTEFMPAGDPRGASRHNFLGVSFLYFLLSALLAGTSAVVLGLAAGLGPLLAAGLGPVVVAACLMLYFRFHAQAARVAFGRVEAEPAGPVSRSEYEDHVARSLEEANLGMLADIAFVGLILFAVLEVLSSLGGLADDQRSELDSATVEAFGPVVFTLAMFVVNLFGLLTYIRVRIAVGQFSLWLDPSDRPFRPLRPTDSFLGYLILAFLFAVSTHLLLVQFIPRLDGGEPWLLGVDACAFLLAVAAEQTTLVVAGRRIHRRSAHATDVVTTKPAEIAPAPAPEPAAPPGPPPGEPAP